MHEGDLNVLAVGRRPVPWKRVVLSLSNDGCYCLFDNLRADGHIHICCLNCSCEHPHMRGWPH